LKKERQEKRVAAIKEDIRKYERIVSSPFGEDMKESAWKILVEKYPDEAGGVSVGDTELLLIRAKCGLNVIGSDGRFFAYDNGAVLDTQTSLMWAAKDNGKDIDWFDAKSYCENYRGGGYSDWRMPTQDEVTGLSGYIRAYIYRPYIYERSSKMKPLINISSNCLWTSERYPTPFFRFSHRLQGQPFAARALPVRGGN